ncbi:MAG: patatin-like phospholipase family protein [Planctomycetaceae bacterium]|nr:patatin-like phospholipase family protein [Planctomycetaceae bacterium]
MQYNILLLSGGTRVAVHVGAYRAIREADATAAAWAGVSAGSLVASVFASGHSVPEAFELMLKTDYRQFLDVRPLTLLRRFGLFAGDRFESWLDSVLAKRRFRDLDVPLSVVATDIGSGEPMIFSNTSTPEVKVATAVRCSISIPGVFAVRDVNGRALFDGCFAPISRRLLFPHSDAPSLCVRMRNARSANAPKPHRLNLAHYIFRVADIVLNSLKELHEPEHWDGDVQVDAGCVSGMKFGLTPEEKQLLCDCGYDACRRTLRSAPRLLQQSAAAPVNPYETLETLALEVPPVLVPG